MFTLGGATSGYCVIGNVRIEATPASMITIEITHANTGRLAKKRASMSLPCLHLGRMDRHARADLVDAFDDQAVAVLEAARHEPAIADRSLGHDGARLDLIACADDERGRVALGIVRDA